MSPASAAGRSPPAAPRPPRRPGRPRPDAQHPLQLRWVAVRQDLRRNRPPRPTARPPQHLPQGGARASRRPATCGRGASPTTEPMQARTRARAPVLVPVLVLVLVLVAGPMARRRRRGRRRCAAAAAEAAAAPRNRRWTAAGRRRCRPRPRTGAAAPFLPLAPHAAAPRRLEVNHAPPARPRRRTAASRACCSRPRRAPPGRAPASVVIYQWTPRGDSKSPRPLRSPRRRGRSADKRRGRGPATAASAPPRRRGAAFFDSRWSRRRPPRPVRDQTVSRVHAIELASRRWRGDQDSVGDALRQFDLCTGRDVRAR